MFGDILLLIFSINFMIICFLKCAFEYKKLSLNHLVIFVVLSGAQAVSVALQLYWIFCPD